MEDDSISVPLKMFARADLQTFRNNFSGAIAVLDSVATLYADNSLTDDVLYRKATIFQKQRKYAEAADLYSKVVKDFSWDLLADDALFQLANLYNYKLNRKPEAKDLYRKMMTDFPGSVYVVDSRTEYRKLESTEPNANSQP
jgi:tetratricopeptide (TPR) repeat protein